MKTPLRYLRFKYQKVSQLFSEKIGTVEATKLDEEFLAVENAFNIHKSLIDNLTENCLEIMYPDLRHRLIMSSKNKIKGKNHQCIYPHIDIELSNNCAKYGKILSETLLGDGLLTMAYSYNEILKLKQEREDCLLQNFIIPLKKTKLKQMDSIIKTRKDMENARVGFDAMQRFQLISKKIKSKDVSKAKDKFDKLRAQTYDGMVHFIIEDETCIVALCEFISANESYHNQSSLVFSKLLQDILKTRQEYKEDYERENCSALPTKNVSYSSRADDCEDQPEEFIRPSAMVIYDFKAEEEDDLDVRAGDLIYLVSDENDEWFMAEHDGKVAMIPKTYVRIVTPL